LAYDKDTNLEDISDEDSVVIEVLQDFKINYSDNSDHHVTGYQVLLEQGKPYIYDNSGHNGTGTIKKSSLKISKADFENMKNENIYFITDFGIYVEVGDHHVLTTGLDV
jgi:hypothetical protein